jgi:SAM-dependent methyltransferase
MLSRMFSNGDAYLTGPVRPCPACGDDKSLVVGLLNNWVMAKCLRCDLVYTRDLPSSQQISEVYDQAYQVEGLYKPHLKELDMMIRSGHSRQGLYRNWVFLKRFKPKAGEKLLEVGCGIGAFLIAAKQRGWLVEGVDISARALEVSRSIHGLPVYHGTLEALDISYGAYKAIVCWEVLEHLPCPRQFLTHVRKLLKKDGLFVCSVPNCSDKVPHFVDSLGPASVPPVHLNFWTLGSFRSFAEMNGFRVMHLFARRSLIGMAGGREHPIRLLWNQFGAILGLREGPNIYAVLTAQG